MSRAALMAAAILTSLAASGAASAQDSQVFDPWPRQKPPSPNAQREAILKAEAKRQRKAARRARLAEMQKGKR